MTSRVRDLPASELTPEQVAILVQELTAIHQQLTAVIDMVGQFADAGGRDWETWERLLEGLGRAGTKLTRYAGDPVHPDWRAAAQHAIAEAAGLTVKDGVLPETVHRKLAEALLTTVWRSGAYYLVSPTDWPDLLPAVVLGAVRSAPHINDHALMDRLRDDGADPGLR